MPVTNNVKGILKRFFFPVAVVAVVVSAFAFIPQSFSTSSASEIKPEDATSAQKAPAVPSEKFCGWSSEGACQSDMDCITSGCSSEVCQSVKEDIYNTICQSGDCYDSELYNLRCACVHSACKWTN